MNKAEIRELLANANIETDDEMTKAELLQLVEDHSVQIEASGDDNDSETETENSNDQVDETATIENNSICKQRGCPDAEETDDGLCSVCGNPIIA